LVEARHEEQKSSAQIKMEDYMNAHGTPTSPFATHRLKFHADGELKKRGKRKEKIVQREALFCYP
jgi:hypothetical protein